MRSAVRWHAGDAADTVDGYNCLGEASHPAHGLVGECARLAHVHLPRAQHHLDDGRGIRIG